ncbi:MAG: IS630 transposase-related protein [Arachidicoccus sp.]|nr:IS630 transposase-related protein [Arachidicoccus sp.]
MSYSIDFRKQLFKIKRQENLTFQETAERFGIPIRTLFRWQKCINPKNKAEQNLQQKIDMEALRKDVEQHPDHYQYERSEEVWG